METPEARLSPRLGPSQDVATVVRGPDGPPPSVLLHWVPPPPMHT